MRKLRYLVFSIIVCCLLCFATSINAASYYETIYIGDSRTVGMSMAVNGKGNGNDVNCAIGNEYWIGKTSSGVGFVNQSFNKLKPNVDRTGTKIIVMSGVNDLNANSYQSSLKTIHQYCNNVFFVSVNPTDENKYHGSASNSRISKFNDEMKRFCEANDIGYIDTYSKVLAQIKTNVNNTDVMGLHYSNSVYKMIHTIVKSVASGQTISNNQTQKYEKNKEANEKVREFAPPEGTEAQAFSPETDEVKQLYIENYGWDYKVHKNRKWKSSQGNKYERQAGWQEDFVLENVNTTKDYLGIGSNADSYGPSVDGADVAQDALKEIGQSEEPPGSDNIKYNTWFYDKEITDGKHPWNGVFITWLMDQSNLLDDGFWKKMSKVSEIYSHCTKKLNCKSYNATATTPFGGNSYNPKAGDLMFLKQNGKWNMVGIITKVGKDKVEIVAGDIEDSVQKITYSKDNIKEIEGASIIDLKYPSGVYGDGSAEQNKDTVFRFLTQEMGYNSAAACGVMANIQAESQFVVKQEEWSGGGGYGICQWTDRRPKLISWCQKNNLDYQTLNGQLQYLKYETKTSYPQVHQYMLNVPNSSKGAGDAAYYWCVHWEIPGDTYGEAAKRQGWAKQNFWPKYGK